MEGVLREWEWEGSCVESRRVVGCVMEDRGLEGWNVVVGDLRWLGWWWGFGDYFG